MCNNGCYKLNCTMLKQYNYRGGEKYKVKIVHSDKISEDVTMYFNGGG